MLSLLIYLKHNTVIIMSGLNSIIKEFIILFYTQKFIATVQSYEQLLPHVLQHPCSYLIDDNILLLRLKY